MCDCASPQSGGFRRTLGITRTTQPSVCVCGGGGQICQDSQMRTEAFTQYIPGTNARRRNDIFENKADI